MVSLLLLKVLKARENRWVFKRVLNSGRVGAAVVENSLGWDLTLGHKLPPVDNVNLLGKKLVAFITPVNSMLFISIQAD